MKLTDAVSAESPKMSLDVRRTDGRHSQCFQMMVKYLHDTVIGKDRKEVVRLQVHRQEAGTRRGWVFIFSPGGAVGTYYERKNQQDRKNRKLFVI